jgi:hypothetical protein
MPELAENIVSKLFASDGNVVLLLGYLSVFPEDLGNMTYNQAMELCKNVNAVNLYGYNNWRLPTLNELKLIYQNRAKLEGLSTGYYISSEYSSNIGYNNSGYLGLDFSNGSTTTSNGYYVGSDSGYIRLVRTDK